MTEPTPEFLGNLCPETLEAAGFNLVGKALDGAVLYAKPLEDKPGYNETWTIGEDEFGDRYLVHGENIFLEPKPVDPEEAPRIRKVVETEEIATVWSDEELITYAKDADDDKA